MLKLEESLKQLQTKQPKKYLRLLKLLNEGIEDILAELEQVARSK